MQCRCCMFEVENGKSSCPVCAFPTLGNISPEKQSIIEEYRIGKLKDISVGIEVYCYGVDSSGELIEKSSEYVKLADALSLAYGEVLWLDRRFESVETNRSVDIDICICRGDVRKNVKVTVTPDESVDYSGCGIYLDSGFTVRFAVGSKEKYYLTEAVSLT